MSAGRSSSRIAESAGAWEKANQGKTMSAIRPERESVATEGPDRGEEEGEEKRESKGIRRKTMTLKRKADL